MAGSKQENKQTLRVAIIATDGFEEVEMTEPRKFLEDQGAKTVLIAPRAGELQAFRHHDKAGQYGVDLTLDEANSEDFDALLQKPKNESKNLKYTPRWIATAGARNPALGFRR